MRELFLEVLRTSLVVSVLIAGIMVTKDKFLAKYSHRFNYFLALIVIIRIFLVVSIKLKVNIGDFIKESYTNYYKVIYNITEAPVNNIRSVDYTYIGMLIWLIGVISVLSYYAYFQRRFYLKIKNNMTSITEMRIEDILNKERKALNITKDIKVKIVNGISSPAIIGILKSTIILPKQEFSNKELSWIFRHELIHFKRKDNIIKLIMLIGTALHWFNPFIYLFRKFFNEQCELSCDEKVINDCKIEDIKEYAMLLVKSARYKNTLKIYIISSQLTNKKVNITKRRVENMLNLKSKKKGIIAGAIVLVVIGGTFFTLNTNKALAATNNETNTSQTILIEDQQKAKESNVYINQEKPLRGAIVLLETYTYKEASEEMRKEHEENCKENNIEPKDLDGIGKVVEVINDKDTLDKVYKGEIDLNDVGNN